MSALHERRMNMSEMNNVNQQENEKTTVFFRGIEGGRFSKDTFLGDMKANGKQDVLKSVTLPLLDPETKEVKWGQFAVLAAAIKEEEKSKEGEQRYFFGKDEYPVTVTFSKAEKDAEGKTVFQNEKKQLLPSEIKSMYENATEEYKRGLESEKAEEPKEKKIYLNRVPEKSVKDSGIENMKNVELYFPGGRKGTVLVSKNAVKPAALFENGKLTNRVYNDRFDMELSKPKYDVSFRIGETDENGKAIYVKEKMTAEEIKAGFYEQLKEYKKGFREMVEECKEEQKADQVGMNEPLEKQPNKEERE